MNKKKITELALDKDEFVIIDSGPFRPSMISLEVSYFMLIVSTLLVAYILTEPKLGNLIYFSVIAVVIVLSYIAYFVSISRILLDRHKLIKAYLSIWGSIFGVFQSFIIFLLLYKPVESLIPQTWWTPLLSAYHLPVTIDGIVLFFVLVVVSSIIYRFVSMVNEVNRFPITVDSALLLVFAVVALFPGAFYYIHIYYQYIFLLFFLSTLIFEGMLFYYLWLTEEERVVVTNKRIIEYTISGKFHIKEHLYDVILDGYSTFDSIGGNSEKYGDISLSIAMIKEDRNERSIVKELINIKGIPDPYIFVDTVLHYSRMKPAIGDA